MNPIINKEPQTLPAVAIRGIATGLLMMGFFTGLWAGIAYGGLQAGSFRFAPLLFLLFIIVFVAQAVKLISISKDYPKLETAEDMAEGKRIGKWFGIIFGAEGLGIFLGINIVINLGHSDLVIPVIALIVGLHFYPLARVFKRTIDYWLATWSVLIALCGIAFTLYKTMEPPAVMAFVGMG
jgi:hypothetical protein